MSQKSKISTLPPLRHDALLPQIKSLNMRCRRTWDWAKLVWLLQCIPDVVGYQ